VFLLPLADRVQVTAVAVLDGDRLYSNLSASDLRVRRTPVAVWQASDRGAGDRA
jgi:hypothetical protein